MKRLRMIRDERERFPIDGRRGSPVPGRASAMRRISIGGTILLGMIPALGRSPSTESLLPEKDPRRMSILIESPAFPGGGTTPRLYPSDGKDVSPPLTWSGIP